MTMQVFVRGDCNFFDDRSTINVTFDGVPKGRTSQEYRRWGRPPAVSVRRGRPQADGPLRCRHCESCRTVSVCISESQRVRYVQICHDRPRMLSHTATDVDCKTTPNAIFGQIVCTGNYG